jgi:hypothetical protein
MDPIIYLRLIGLTAGTLLPLFWMVVILGYRRQRNFERVFFFNSLHDYPVMERGEIHCHLEKPSSKVSCVSTFVRLYATSAS